MDDAKLPPPPPMPTWFKLLLAASAGAGAHKVATDSPVHIAVVGEAPGTHEGWVCGPEGGIIGAPMVCRPIEESLSTATSLTQ